LPAVQSLHEEFEETREGVIVGITTSPEKHVHALIDDFGLTFRNIHDPNDTIGSFFYTDNVTPIYIFVDKQGRIAHRVNGAPEDRWLESWMNELAQE